MLNSERKPTVNPVAAPYGLLPFDPRAALRRVNGDILLLHQLMDLFLDEHISGLRELQRAAEERDLFRLKHVVSAFRGAAGHFVADRLTEAAMRLEASCQEGHSHEALSLIPPFEKELTQLVGAIRRVRRRSAERESSVGGA